MNIIQNTTKGDPDISRMGEHEISDLIFQSFVVIHVHRSSFSLNHIDIYSDYTSIRTNDVFLYTSYCFGKTQAFLNIYTNVNGLFYSNIYASTNVYAENITMNMDNMIGGFRYASA